MIQWIFPALAEVIYMAISCGLKIHATVLIRPNALFLFCGGRLDRFKMLYYENDGYLLLYKRLDQGKFHWPRTKEEIRQLSHQQLRWLLEGISIDQPKAIRSGKKGIF